MILPLAFPRDKGQTLTAGPYKVMVQQYFPDFKMGREPSPDDPPNNPAVQLHVSGPCGEKDLFAFARFEFHGNRFEDGTAVTYHRPEGASALVIVSSGSDALAVYTSKTGKPATLAAGSPLSVGTGADEVRVTLVATLASSTYVKRVRPDDTGKGPPAFLVQVGPQGEKNMAQRRHGPRLLGRP